MKKFAVFAVLILCLLPTFAQDEVLNLVDECVVDYDPDVDYFPSKVTFDYAEGAEIEYHNNYKVVRTLVPYPGAEEPLEYVLVQCGTPAPDAADFASNAQFIEVPAGDIISMSTTQLPPLKELDLLDHLIGVDSIFYVNTPEVVELYDAGELLEVGYGASVNIEVVLNAEPSIVMTYGYTADDAPAVLMDAGVFTAVNNEWLEETLIARAEWIKFVAVFYNEESRANEFFDAMIADYESVAALTADIPAEERLVVLWNAYSSYGEAWNIPGQQTWVGDLLADAGVNYVLMDDVPEGSVPMDFEVVYDAGFDAPVWMPNAFMVNTLDDLLALDSRYADFAAVEGGMVYNDTARVNANGGNDYWETGITNPNLILRDLVSIFYPELLPDHELTFYVKLESAE